MFSYFLHLRKIYTIDEIIDLFDGTVKGIIVKENENPYIKIKLGDQLHFN